MNLCKYRDIFGKVGTGVHSFRFLNIAIVDTLLTLAAAYVINSYLQSNLLVIFFILMLLSIVIHKAFCVETTLTKMFFSFK
uniref:RDD domain-containing protein n=1 Tax=viral metagenome TaxID=1070528 RepID=A0A6C0DVG7_9ZZZZ